MAEHPTTPAPGAPQHPAPPTSAPRPKIGMRVVVGAIVVLLAWLAVGGVGGQYLGKLSGLQKNDNASFLPESAESTQVSEALAKFTDDQTLPLIVVAERPGGLTPQDLATAQTFAQGIPQTPIKIDGESTSIGDYLLAPQLAAIPSEDGAAFIIVVPLDGESTSKAVGETTPLDVIGDTMRTQVADDLRSTGLTAYVTGPGGFISDLVNAFAGIDGILLVVALGVVLVILLIVYRSPVLPIAVLATAIFGLSAAGLVVYLVADAGLITVTGQSQGILSILVVGAATDYSLLLVARYKEELHDVASSWTAMKRAWRATLPPIVASAGTVILGLLALMLAELKGTAGLGPVGALGILGALLAAVTFLPAVLVIGRRWIFWPSIPRLDHVHRADVIETGKGWGRVARFVGQHSRSTWIVTTLSLVAAALFLPTLKADGIAQSDLFLTKVDSVQGQDVLAAHFDAGAGSPVQILTPQDKAQAVVDALGTMPGVADPTVGLAPGAPPKVVDGKVVVQATLTSAADSPEAATTVEAMRTDLDAISPDILVGGASAQALDIRQVADRDMLVVIPTIIAVVFLVLVLLLRSLVAPLLLMVANVLSFAATMGISAIVFNHVFHFPGGDPTTVLFGFVFLIALGVDYSIFLMTRAREETATHGTKRGVLIALAVTGGVITSAGIVLAATFSALAVLPLLFLVQIAFIVAFGVLLDTFVVRTLLVPALVVELGDRTWWPSKVAIRQAGDEAKTVTHV